MFNDRYSGEGLRERALMSWVATAILGGAAVSAASTAYSSNRAADIQRGAAQDANAILKDQYNTTRSDLAPYRQMGVDANTELQQRLPFLTSPIVMDQAALEQTPGYQFTRTQGLKAVQNSAAARGLGVSGAALKGAATFATGLADNTYQTQFNLENVNRTNAFNRLKSLIDTGAGAAAGGAVLGQQNSAAQGANLVGAGNAGAAATNATGTAISNVGNSISGYGMYQGLYGNRGAAGSGTASGGGGLPASYPIYGPGN